MKRTLFLLMATFLLASCSKEHIGIPQEDLLVEKIKQYFADSLSQHDFYQLNFSRLSICKYNDNVRVVTVPFIDSSISSSHFIVMKIDKDGRFAPGKMVEVDFGKNVPTRKRTVINGSITISSLDRSSIFRSPVVNGFITGFYADPSANSVGTTSFIDPYQNLPQVIIVGYSPMSTDNYEIWYNMMCILGMTANGGYQYQSYSNPYGNYGGAGGNTGSTGGGGSAPTQPYSVDFEYDFYKSGIDVIKYLKCFDAISDIGATASITILTDIPVDSDPNVFFDWANGSPGHTFIRLNKSNGNQHVQQIIGFYPVNGWKTAFLPDPIEAKFVDNGQHEFNASLRMTLTPDQLKNVLNQITVLSTIAKYDIDEYNCTDFALSVFNLNRIENPLLIPKANLPGGNAAIQSNTPQGLFQKLKTMKEQGHPESVNINMPAGKAFEALSNGPCN